MRPLAALCHLALGRLARRRHDRREHAKHLATAATMFRELRMPFWQARASTEAEAD
jgi:hypothetical protein